MMVAGPARRCPALPPSAQARNRRPTASREYRKMLEDGNPAELFEAKGEGLWKQKRGPRNATLEALRPGQGPGRGQGRLRRSCRATLPTPAACMDLETRLVALHGHAAGLRCGGDRASTPFGSGEQANVTALATWVAADVARHALQPARRRTRRSAAATRSASACSSTAAARTTSPVPPATRRDGQRIRLQDLPNLTRNPGDGVGFAAWPPTA
jgi:sulfur-oxidizing protein SoxA